MYIIYHLSKEVNTGASPNIYKNRSHKFWFVTSLFIFVLFLFSFLKDKYKPIYDPVSASAQQQCNNMVSLDATSLWSYVFHSLHLTLNLNNLT